MQVMIGETSEKAQDSDFDESRRVPASLKHQYVKCEEWRTLGNPTPDQKPLSLRSYTLQGL